jgi:hypothetical protein
MVRPSSHLHLDLDLQDLGIQEAGSHRQEFMIGRQSRRSMAQGMAVLRNGSQDNLRVILCVG